VVCDSVDSAEELGRRIHDSTSIRLTMYVHIVVKNRFVKGCAKLYGESVIYEYICFFLFPVKDGKRQCNI